MFVIKQQLSLKKRTKQTQNFTKMQRATPWLNLPTAQECHLAPQGAQKLLAK